MDRLRFGTFLAPFHPAGENPTLALQRDLELVEHLDRLGYDEAWIGEHHSAGSEIIASPEIFIAAAAERTTAHQARHRRHLARLPQPAVGGRPDGAARPPHPRPDDARRRAGLAAHRLGDDRPRTRPTPASCSRPTSTSSCGCCAARAGHRARPTTHKLRRRPAAAAPVHRAAASTSPSPPSPRPPGPRLAGQHGIGLLSIGATLTKEGFDALAYHWGVVEERAAALRHDGRPRATGAWSGPMHIAETERAGLPRRRVRHRAVVPLLPEGRRVPADGASRASDVKEMIDFINEAGVGVIGTPEDARAQVQRLVGPVRRVRLHAAARPRVGQPGGDEALLGADRPAGHAVLPGRADSHAQPTLDRAAHATSKRDDYAAAQMQAVATMTERYQQEVAAGKS